MADILNNGFTSDDDFDNFEEDDMLLGDTAGELDVSGNTEVSDSTSYDEDGADDFGSDIDLEEEGLAELSPKRVESSFDFIAADGSVSVMSTEHTKHSFKLIEELPISNLAIAGYRIRKDPSVVALQQSIKQTGLLCPIIVAPTMSEDTYVLVHGFKRVLAYMKAGSTTIPAIVNNRIKSSEISIVEALYNMHTPYSMRECADFIKYLESERGIMSPSLFEMLLQWNNGDYSKYKDILDDNDPDIIEKLFGGEYTIQQAFQALEKRRKKESREEKQIQQASKAYASGDTEKAEGLTGTGSEIDEEGPGLSDEEIKSMMIDPTKLDDDIDDIDLDQMVEEGKNMEGFEPHKQDWQNREIIDPAIRKAVMARDNNTCQCCKRGGPDYVDILDLHHIVEVFLDGEDSVDNGLAVCLNCHKQIHLYALGKLTIPKTLTADELEAEIGKAIIDENAKRERQGASPMSETEVTDFKETYRAKYKEEQNKYKRIVKLGNVIRSGMAKKGMKKEQYLKEHPIDKIGRLKPGVKNQRG